MPVTANNTLTQERLKEVVSYSQDTGEFHWCGQRRVGVRNGDLAGSAHPSGYRRITIDGRAFLAHRLAWLYVYGVWPTELIDHINGHRGDNRIANLRDADRNTNMQNRRAPGCSNTSGFLGVSWHKRCKKWRACINSRQYKADLGLFDTPEEAHAAYLAAKRQTQPGCTI
jgi:hypothetical protein